MDLTALAFLFSLESAEPKTLVREGVPQAVQSVTQVCSARTPDLRSIINKMKADIFKGRADQHVSNQLLCRVLKIAVMKGLLNTECLPEVLAQHLIDMPVLPQDLSWLDSLSVFPFIGSQQVQPTECGRYAVLHAAAVEHCLRNGAISSELIRAQVELLKTQHSLRDCVQFINGRLPQNQHLQENEFAEDFHLMELVQKPGLAPLNVHFLAFLQNEILFLRFDQELNNILHRLANDNDFAHEQQLISTVTRDNFVARHIRANISGLLHFICQIPPNVNGHWVHICIGRMRDRAPFMGMCDSAFTPLDANGPLRRYFAFLYATFLRHFQAQR